MIPASEWLPLLRELAEIEPPRTDAMFAHPEVFAPECEDAWWAALEQMPGPERSRLSEVLDEVAAARVLIESRLTDYVLGAGPIERLWFAVTNKELDVAHAERLAREQAVRAVQAPIYVAVLRTAAVKSAKSAEIGLILLRLLVAALEVRPGGAIGDRPGRETCLSFADLAGKVLRDEADGRLFKRACGLASPVVEWAREAGDRQALADAIWTLARLHLYPWVARRRVDANLEMTLWRWERRFYERHADELAGVAEEEWQLPPAKEAVGTARRLYQELADLREGHERAMALKSCVDAGGFLMALGEEVDPAELVETATEALALMEPDHDPQERLSLVNEIRAFGGSVDRSQIELVLGTSVDEQVRRHGRDVTEDVLRQASMALAPLDPARALEVARDLRTVIALDGTERGREDLWIEQLDLTLDLYAPDPPEFGDLAELDAAADEFRRRAGAEAWDVMRLAGGLLRLARSAGRIDAEARGVALLDEVIELAPAFALEYADALTYQRAELHIGLGSNAYLGGDIGAAVEPYGTALTTFLDLGVPSRALDVVARLRDCVRDGDPDVAFMAAGQVGSFALDLQLALGDPAVRMVQGMCKLAIARMAIGSFNPAAIIFLLQAAKGQRFGAQFFAGASYSPEQDAEGIRLLEQIGELEREGGTALGPARTAVDEAMLLTAYIRPDDPQSGDAPADRLANLRQAYDSHVNAQLLGSKPQVVYMPLDVIQQSLDARTVMLILYLGMTPGGNLGVTCVAMSDDHLRVMTVDHGAEDRIAEVTLGGRKVRMSPLAFLVQQLREELDRPPEPWVATPEALQWLEAGRASWFGNLLDDLSAWRAAGKDHLCIVPHGPLHMYPFHLIPEGRQPLAATWQVTYLPNLYLLLADRRAGVRRPHPRPLAAFGLSYETENPFGLAPLPQARGEAITIAEHFGVDPVLDGDVTERRVAEGLLGSRWIHLAAHGRHDVDAPSFQCLYLTPDDESDGRLSAHELLAYDLRGTELVTLSACETALGRFDSADNLSGLPASLMLAGVETIVGTLWRVETMTSEHFFSELYRHLKDGAGRLEAFTRAQHSTRDRFPAYRDWGCFYYMGEWR